MSAPRTLALALALAVIGAGGALCGAEPALGRPRAAGPLSVIYPDAQNALAFYYPPGSLHVAEDAAGGPDLRFLQMIYMGSHATDDPGRFIARSVLSFRVRMSAPSGADLAAARAALPAGARLLPLPIRRAETTVVWTPLADTTAATPAASPEPQAAGSGRLEDADGGAVTDGGYWTERIFTLNPDPLSSQALWDALQKRRVLLSVSYTFFSAGDTEGPTAVSGTADAVGAIATAAPRPHATKEDVAAVRTDTLAIVLAPSAVADRLKRVDLNQAVPPGYAALDIRCYDFGNALRPDLALKTVEVAASGVSGRPVTRAVSFRSSTPDVTSATLRFPFAVRLDRPFRYRVTEVSRDGDAHVGAWHEQAEWARLLDLTSPTPATPSPTATPQGDEL